MRGRKRKTRYSWFPSIGTDVSSLFDQDETTWAGTCGSLHIAPGSADQSPTDILGLTFDYPTEVEEAAVVGAVPSLADFQGSEYQLERFVGSLFLTCRNTALDSGGSPDAPVLVTAGLEVLRVEEETGAPIGLADPQRYSPMVSDNISDPWIWRRSWMLSGEQVINTAVGGSQIVRQGSFPRSNVSYGDIESGPKIDSRSVRRVRREERLFMIIQMVALDHTCPKIVSEGDVGPTVDYALDYRILGRLVKASAHGNTSR